MKTQTLVDLLRARAEERPGQLAYTLIGDHGGPEAACAYAELDLAARSIAAEIQIRHGAPRVVALAFPTSLNFLAAFFGCLYAGAIAVPTPRLRSGRDLSRIHGILKNSGATLLLMDGSLADA